MEIESFFFDFDGTLQGFESHQISSSTKEAIKKLKDKNYKIYIATGRRLKDLPQEIFDLNFDGYVNSNGAMCSDANRVPFKVEYISKTDVLALFDYASKKPFSFSFMTENDFIINTISDKVQEAFNYFNLATPREEDLTRLPLDKILQMNIFVDEIEEKYLIDNVLKNCESSRWIDLFADVNPIGITKMFGIENMAKKDNLNLNKTMAFGDGGNDIPMLKGCTIGVAMGTAKKDVIAVADYVTDSADENGIWNALKHYNIL